ncbi:MAG: PD-(D/E)XK nuclease family protein [Muribaculaceae bacterium]|nr:PD-(D/E)XK nuclease family protein [Muribaculaceae bacterium]
MNKSDLIKFGLEFSNRLDDYNKVFCNPLAEFIPYVTTKEIVHTSIISNLLSENGNHGEGNIFLINFFKLIGLNPEDYTDIYVKQERKVSRVLTEGHPRSIDICITYKDRNGYHHAIVIENKINHAAYQYLQIEDYVNALNVEALDVDKIVLIHDHLQSIVGNPYTGERFVYLYPNDIYTWIKKSTSNPEILAYGKYLNTLNNSVISKTNAHKMKNLDLAEIKNLKKVADAYNNLAFELREEIVASVKKSLPEMEISSTFGKLDEGWKGLQLWNPESYKKNGVWVTVFPPYDPADDEKGYDIYLYAKEDKQAEATEAAEKCDYKLYGSQEGYCYFRNKSGDYSFHMFPAEERKKLVDEVVRLLTQLRS